MCTSVQVHLRVSALVCARIVSVHRCVAALVCAHAVLAANRVPKKIEMFID